MTKNFKEFAFKSIISDLCELHVFDILTFEDYQAIMSIIDDIKKDFNY